MFWDKVDVKTIDECWIWRGAISSSGYGSIWRNGSSTSAHRVAYTECYGIIPIGLGVLHKCDNPLCCNPNHLFLGNQSHNLMDCNRKGRIGSRLRIQFVNSQVDQIRYLFSQNYIGREIAEIFGTGLRAIYKVKNFESPYS